MLLKRHRIPRREELHGDRAYWHWTDLRIGSVIDLYAKRYHICSCDDFTREYLESEGIAMNDKEVSSPFPIAKVFIFAGFVFNHFVSTFKLASLTIKKYPEHFVRAI